MSWQEHRNQKQMCWALLDDLANFSGPMSDFICVLFFFLLGLWMFDQICTFFMTEEIHSINPVYCPLALLLSFYYHPKLAMLQGVSRCDSSGLFPVHNVVLYLEFWHLKIQFPLHKCILQKSCGMLLLATMFAWAVWSAALLAPVFGLSSFILTRLCQIYCQYKYWNIDIETKARLATQCNSVYSVFVHAFNRCRLTPRPRFEPKKTRSVLCWPLWLLEVKITLQLKVFHTVFSVL